MMMLVATSDPTVLRGAVPRFAGLATLALSRLIMMEASALRFIGYTDDHQVSVLIDYFDLGGHRASRNDQSM